jgi:hypothetical protein
MPFRSYTEAWCDVCGRQILGGACQEWDGTSENDGLVFCGGWCKKMHAKEVQVTKNWYKEKDGINVEHIIHRESYRQYCFSCENFKNLEPNSSKRGYWYNHVCIASGDILGVKTWTGDNEEKFEDCSTTIKHCFKHGFKHRKQIFVEPEEIDRFELMDFD